MNLGRFARGYRGGATLRPVRQLRSQAYPEYAGVPPDGEGNIGDKAIDTTKKIVYKKRWVANREGVGDGILFPINLFPSVGDFDFECMVRVPSAIGSTINLCVPSPGASSAQFWIINTGSFPVCALRNSSNVVQYIASPDVLSFGEWVKIGAKRVGNVLTTTKNGVVDATVADTSGWTPSLVNTGTSILSSATNTDAVKFCNFRLTAPGGTITARLDEGAGTVISNSTGANGTLTDASPANFWYAAWVPE